MSRLQILIGLHSRSEGPQPHYIDLAFVKKVYVSVSHTGELVIVSC